MAANIKVKKSIKPAAGKIQAVNPIAKLAANTPEKIGISTRSGRS